MSKELDLDILRYYSQFDNGIKNLKTPMGGIVILGDGSEHSLKVSEIIDGMMHIEMDGLAKWGKEVWRTRKSELENANTRKTLIRKYKLENLDD